LQESLQEKDSGYRIQVTKYRLQDTGYRIQESGYRSQVTGYKLHAQESGNRDQETKKHVRDVMLVWFGFRILFPGIVSGHACLDTLKIGNNNFPLSNN